MITQRPSGTRVCPPSMARIAAAGLTVAVLAGCANPAAERALLAQQALVGMPKATLLSCAGVPERQATADGSEFYTYSTGRVVSYPAGPMWPGPWYSPYPYAWGWPGSYSRDVRSYSCDVTFTITDGVVRRIVYGGPDAGDPGECYSIVSNCLAAAR